MKRFTVICLALIMFATAGASVYASKQSSLNAAVDEVVGTPYKWGGTTTSGFDCSGFVRFIFDQYKIDLPRTSSGQAGVGTEVAKSDLRLGDLVFFNTSGKGISHAGIYVGDGKFAHASSSRGVVINSLSEKYYDQRYVTARRVASEQVYKQMIEA